MSPTKPLSRNTGLLPQDGDLRTSVAMCTCTRVGHNYATQMDSCRVLCQLMSSDALVHFYEYLRKTCRTDRCVPRKQAIVSSRGQSTTVIAQSANMSSITKGHAHTQQDNVGVRAFSGTEFIRCALQKYSMSVAKPFDPCCKTIRCVLQNHSIRVAKPFEPCCQTIRFLIN